jgi:hydroxypyruvate isomerase
LFKYSPPHTVASALNPRVTKEETIMPPARWGPVDANISMLFTELPLQDNLDVVMDLGARLGCRRFNLLYGNRIDGADAAGQDELAAENLARATQAAEQINAVVLVEPLSGAPRYPLRTADDVLRVLDRLPAGRVHAAGLLADLYHLHVNGADIAATLNRVHSRIGHVQIADVPGRHEPGTGRADVDGWVRQLRQLGYREWIGLEYAPLETTMAGLHRMGLNDEAALPPRRA